MILFNKSPIPIPCAPLTISGSPRPKVDEGWTCPSCGTTGIKGKFCPDCGTKKSEE